MTVSKGTEMQATRAPDRAACEKMEAHNAKAWTGMRGFVDGLDV